MCVAEMGMATVEIPDFPDTSEQLEDYVGALFQAAGYFVERNMTGAYLGRWHQSVFELLASQDVAPMLAVAE